MARWNQFTGILGLVLGLFGVISLLVLGPADPGYTIFHLGGSLALIIYWLVTVGFKRANEASQVLSGRTVRFGTTLIVYTVLFVALLTGANWFANRYNKRVDLTEQGVYSLAAQTSDMLASLKRPLKIAIFELGQESEKDPKELLALYKGANPAQVTTELVNPRSKPHLVDLYGMKAGNLAYLEYGEGTEKQVSRLNEVTEEAITNAVIKLTQGDAKKIYFLQGHGERSLEDGKERGLKAFADAVRDEHLTMEPLLLSSRGSIPTDAAAVILAAPTTPLLPGEREILISYVNGGGRLMLLTDPQGSEDVRAIAGSFGIEVGNDVVIDLVQRLMAGPTLATEFLSNTFGDHPITKRFTTQDVMVFSMASSVKSSAQSDGVSTYTELVRTSPNGWGEKNLSALFDAGQPTATFEETDLKGPVSLAVAFERKLSSAELKEGEFEKIGRVVVFGDSDWISNQFFKYSSHRDAVLNSLNWLAGQEGGVTIRPRAMKGTLTPISATAFRALFMTGFIIPEGLVLLGLIIWWRRKNATV